MQITTFVAGFVAYAWLLIIVQRQELRRQLPWFAFYVLWECCATLVQLVLWVLSRKSYFNAYWWMEAVEVGLILAAVRESFLRLFQGLSKRAGFRWLVWSLIASVVIYSTWMAIATPSVQRNKFGIFEVDAELLFRWGIFGIAGLTVVLSFLLEGTIRTREAAIVVGFGIASLAFVIFVGSYSVLGPKYSFFTQYVPSVGYFLAVGWWIWVFSRPVEKFGFKELGIGPDDMRREMRRYGEDLDR